jgi:hypothetical protein
MAGWHLFNREGTQGTPEHSQDSPLSPQATSSELAIKGRTQSKKGETNVVSWHGSKAESERGLRGLKGSFGAVVFFPRENQQD